MKRALSLAAFTLATILPAAFAQSLLPTGDTFVAAGNLNNFGTSPLINVGGAAGYQGLIQFDLSSLPGGITGASIAKASLTLFVNKVGSAGAISISAANAPWLEGTVNGSNAPSPGMVVAGSVPVSAAGTYTTVDATALVKAWLDGVITNQGVLLTVDPAFPGTSAFLDSKESASTSHPAMLQVTLVGGGATGPAGAAGPQGAAGLTGPQGLAGSAGANGATGPNGPTGSTGPIGSAGANGANGLTGANGLNGANGAPGAAGPIGPAGPAGAATYFAVTGNNPSFFGTQVSPKGNAPDLLASLTFTPTVTGKAEFIGRGFCEMESLAVENHVRFTIAPSLGADMFFEPALYGGFLGEVSVPAGSLPAGVTLYRPNWSAEWVSNVVANTTYTMNLYAHHLSGTKYDDCAGSFTVHVY